MKNMIKNTSFLSWRAELLCWGFFYVTSNRATGYRLFLKKVDHLELETERVFLIRHVLFRLFFILSKSIFLLLASLLLTKSLWPTSTACKRYPAPQVLSLGDPILTP